MFIYKCVPTHAHNRAEFVAISQAGPTVSSAPTVFSFSSSFLFPLASFATLN